MIRYLIFFLLLKVSMQHAGWRTINRIRDVNENPFVSNDIISRPGNTSDDQFFTQQLDHFSYIRNKDTFFQRYAYNKAYYKPSSKLVFVYIEGEAPMNKERLNNGFIVDLAERYGAFLTHLEHRFYGKSVPNQKLDLATMKFLSAEQALEDLVQFTDHLKSQFSFRNHKFVVVGGSYAGMLSSWARNKYPHIFFASLASSAPVQATLQFSQYESVVSDSLSNIKVGGSDLCTKVIKKAFKKLSAFIAADDTKTILKSLKPCSIPTNKKDWWIFNDNLRGIFDGAVQYNANERDINVKNLCDIMTSDEMDPIEALSGVVEFYLDATDEECLESSYDDYIKLLRSEEISSDKSWYYQTCTEFGFYQDCVTDANCLFSNDYSVNFDMNVCIDALDVNTHLIDGYIGLTNNRYGSLNPQASRIIYTNGKIDPWHSLGIVNDRSSYKQHVLFNNESSHCQELHQANSQDPKSLKQTRKQIIEIMDDWFDF